MLPPGGRASSTLGFLLTTSACFTPSFVAAFKHCFVYSTVGTPTLRSTSSLSRNGLLPPLWGVSFSRGSRRSPSELVAPPAASAGRGRVGEGCRSAWKTSMTSDMATEQAIPSVRLGKDDGREEEDIALRNDANDEEANPSTPSTSRRKRRILGAGRRTGDVKDEGFSGTRVGFHTLKEYEVPREAPTNLPDGEDRGYPMLLYQFMHAQYPEDFPSQSRSRKAVRRKELLFNGEEVRNDIKARLLHNQEDVNTTDRYVLKKALDEIFRKPPLSALAPSWLWSNRAWKVQPGDVITSQKRVQPGLFPMGKPTCNFDVVWEDDFIAIINKPPGVAVHGGTGPEDPGPGGRRSVRQSLPYILTPTKSDDSPLHRPLHCHRLDKPTGGLLVCAKTRPALVGMNDAFEKRLVSKRYVALVSGILEGKGCIVTPLDDKPSVTNFKARRDPVRSLRTDYATTVDLWPVTGRFHQLRRHLASIGNPIVGDARYSEDAEDADDVDNSHHHHQGGMFLQAVELTFPHPITGEELNFSIPEPAKFGRWREREHRRWTEHHEAAVASRIKGPQGSVVPELKTPPQRNVVPEVKGLQVEDRDGFRYYQYDWSAVGGPPSPLSLKDIDDALETGEEDP